MNTSVIVGPYGRCSIKIATVQRLIRNRRLQHFLTSPGTWTRDHKQALLFPTQEDARKARDEFRLVDYELYLVGDASSLSDFALALERL